MTVRITDLFPTIDGTSAPVDVQDEGVTVDAATSKLNFKGDAIEVIKDVGDGAGDVTVIVNAAEASYQGGYDANTNTPDLSTPMPGIKKGDLWDVTVAGSLHGEDLAVGDIVRARVDNPGS